MSTLGARTLSILRDAEQRASLGKKEEPIPPWAKQLISEVRDLSNSLKIKRECDSSPFIKESVENIPPVTLGGAVSIMQKAALREHGYDEDHKCDLCPHPEVSRTLGRKLKEFLARFPRALDKYA